MNEHYRQLSLPERRKIAQLLSARTPVRLIAKAIGRHVSTIYRELKRNFFYDDDRFYRGYFPLAAEDKARERRERTGKIHRNSEFAAYVADRLQECWSPEQIAGYLKHHASQSFHASHETIYRYVYSRDGHRQELYRLLPVARRTRRPRRSRRPRGPQIPRENTIAMRPLEISERMSIGHWEADLVQFRKEHGKANVTSLVERKSRYTYLMRNPDRSSAGVIGGIESKLGALPSALRQTITFDRGTEFASYPRLKEKLGVESYFCNAQAPWQNRRDCLGELIQIDGCDHPWFEDRAPRCTLLVFIDDATSRLMLLHMAPSESAMAYMQATQVYIERKRFSTLTFSGGNQLLSCTFPGGATINAGRNDVRN